MAGDLHPGDLCITGRNSYPKFRVIALHEDRVWVRDVVTGKDAVVPVGHCHKLAERSPVSQDAAPAPEPGDEEGRPAVVRWPDGSVRP